MLSGESFRNLAPGRIGHAQEEDVARAQRPQQRGLDRPQRGIQRKLNPPDAIVAVVGIRGVDRNAESLGDVPRNFQNATAWRALDGVWSRSPLPGLVNHTK